MASRKRTKPKSIEFWVEPYKCKVFAGTDKKALEQRILKDIKKECKTARTVELPPAEGGGAYTCELGDGIYAVLFDDARASHMVHEAVHVANLVMSRIGQDATYQIGEDEHYAYLVESIFNEMHNKL